MTWPGAYQGVIVSTADPQGAGRVRLQVPQVSGTALTPWAAPAQQGAGTPAVGQVVWVVYQGGDPSYPVYIPPVPPVPVWQTDSSAVIGGMTLGSGTVVSRYLVEGHVVHWAVVLTWASDTTASPSSAITVSAPVTPDAGSGMRWVGSVMFSLNNGGVWRSGGAWMLSGTTAVNIEAQRASDLGYVTFSTAALNFSSGGWISMTMRYDKA